MKLLKKITGYLMLFHVLVAITGAGYYIEYKEFGLQGYVVSALSSLGVIIAFAIIILVVIGAYNLIDS